MLFRFRRLWKHAGAKGFADQWYTGIIAAYSESHRKYHTMHHLEECFALFENVEHLLKDPIAVAFAIWYHDLIYDVHVQSGNEEASALLAGRLLAEGRLSVTLQDTVMSYIRATANHTTPTDDLDLKYFLDIDLAILGAPETRFDEFDHQVRAEYNWVDEALFRKLRAGILEGFLHDPFLYKTAYFREKFEAHARANLARAIARLRL